MVDGNTTEAYCIHLRSITQVLSHKFSRKKSFCS